jgi:hypothetical protein
VWAELDGVAALAVADLAHVVVDDVVESPVDEASDAGAVVGGSTVVVVTLWDANAPESTSTPRAPDAPTTRRARRAGCGRRRFVVMRATFGPLPQRTLGGPLDLPPIYLSGGNRRL